MSLPEQQRRARDLAIAALLGENIYNFGELLLHPILNTLQGTPEAWLRELLFAFNAGDLAKYNSLLPNFEKNELLHGQQSKLREKICLSALTEAVFRRPPHDRAMTFATIHQETRVDPAEIEFMLMRALSLGLLKGKIDQVAEVARISWVQPKVLDKNQIEGMRQRLMEWDGSVSKLAKWMEEKMAMPANTEALVAGVR
jgi:26S proteasome regulatory subunit N9